MSSLTPHSLPRARHNQPLVASNLDHAAEADQVSTFHAGNGLRRVDGAHQSTVTSSIATPNSPDGITRDGWLRLHADDLIEQLQAWSQDLDARAAQLNAAMSQHDLRERQIRLRQQEIEAALQRQQQELDGIASEVQAQARRLAFQHI